LFCLPVHTENRFCSLLPMYLGSEASDIKIESYVLGGNKGLENLTPYRVVMPQ